LRQQLINKARHPINRGSSFQKQGKGQKIGATPEKTGATARETGAVPLETGAATAESGATIPKMGAEGFGTGATVF
jgi:hypothetical protein